MWSLGLIANGLFIAFAVIRYGVNRFRIGVINTSEGDQKIGRFYNFMIRYIIPAQGLILLVWYVYQSVTSFQGGHWWNPFHVYSIGSLIFQWGIGIGFFLLVNKWMAKKSLSDTVKVS